LKKSRKGGGANLSRKPRRNKKVSRETEGKVVTTAGVRRAVGQKKKNMLFRGHTEASHAPKKKDRDHWGKSP